MEKIIIYRIKTRWLKWRSAFEIFWDHKILTKLKEFYRIVIRHAMLYGSKCSAIKEHVKQLSVKNWGVEIDEWNMLGERMRTECICAKLKVTIVKDKMKKNRLTLFTYMQQRLISVPIWKSDRIMVNRKIRTRRRPKQTWMETSKNTMFHSAEEMAF